MSRYLISQIEASRNITVEPWTEVDALDGDPRLERVRSRNTKTGTRRLQEIRHVFLMTDTNANTGWLDGSLTLDDKRFIKTGADVGRDWPLTHPTYLLETSVPGIFAVGDVRSGSVKRVASAVGEGSMAIQFIHKVLARVPDQA